VPKKWRVIREAPDRCPIHNKSTYRSEGEAIRAAREVERANGHEPKAMSWYYCAESKGWHIGHRSIRSRLEG
jgi:hypothetical protein